MVRLSFDTAERASDPSLDCGVWFVTVPDEDEQKTREAIELLGFTVIDNG